MEKCSRSDRVYAPFIPFLFIAILYCLSSCDHSYEEVKLKQVKDVLVDGTSDPKLKGTAIFHNPNDVRGKLKRINIDIYVNGKKAGTIDQRLKIAIPAKGDFSVPLEVKLHMKELGFFDTLMGVLGGKKFDVHYKGSLKLTYHGVPIKVPVDYKDEIKVKF